MEEEGIDVQELLNRKLKSGKFDVKGKNAEMLVLLRQFKACVRHMIEQVEDLEMQIVTTRSDMERLAEAHKNDLERADLEASKLLDKVHSLESQVTDHRGQVKNAEDNIKKLQSELASKEASIREIEFKNKSQEADIKKLSLELQQAKDETDKLQELNKRAQEYASGLQEYNSKLQDDAAAMQQANSKLHKEKADLSQDVASFKGQIEAIQMQLTSAQEGAKAVEESRAALREEVNKLHSRISDLEKEKTSYIEDLEKTKVELKQFRETSGQTAEEVAEAHARAQGLQKEHKQQQEIIAELRRQLDIAKQQKEITEGICSEKAADLEQHLQHVAHLQKSLVDAQRRIEEGEATRKKLHNTILELKGNIRVFCRVRALMEHEQTGVDGEVISFPEETDENRGRTIDLAISKGDEGKPNNLYNFVFDKVFPPDVSQELVFEEISQLVQSALDGYKVSIFAYGQTGSGKTYTMFGPSSLGNEAGMIPRSMLQIFESSGELAQRGWEFKMGASMLEIYNEDVVDLLGKKLPAGKTHQIQHDGKGNTHITDLTVVEVTHPNQVEKLMNRATNCRSVGSTNINERSSRSHCVFRLTIDGSNPATGQQVHGVLNLIDLAGSERLAKSGAVGERLKETQAINKSLSALGDVICALNEQSAHIPYRNSKLTYLLQPCLGGDSKTLMFVNLNPRPDAVSESLCSLRFAAKVNACEVGTARRNTGRKK